MRRRIPALIIALLIFCVSCAAASGGVTADGLYTARDDVALYLHLYGELPVNFITKSDARALGWDSQQNYVGDVAPGMSIGGDRFGNYEGLLPEQRGREYRECDIDYSGNKRNAKRLVYSDDGLIYYTSDHYESFTLLYSPISYGEAYTALGDVALYLHLYGELPVNFITKSDARALGWDSQQNYVGDVAPGMSIGGDRFGNYEGLLPEQKGREYRECDIDYSGNKRNAQRLVYSDDGLIYYTDDHYESFTPLYDWQHAAYGEDAA